MPYFCQFICLYSALPLWYCNIRRRIKSLRTKLSARVISALLCGEFGDRKSCRQEKGKNLIQRVQRSNPLAHLRHKSAIMSEMSSKITSSPLPKCHPHFTDYPIIGTFIPLSSIVGACASVPCIWKWTTNFHCFREKFCHYRWLRMNRFATSTKKKWANITQNNRIKRKNIHCLGFSIVDSWYLGCLNDCDNGWLCSMASEFFVMIFLIFFSSDPIYLLFFCLFLLLWMDAVQSILGRFWRRRACWEGMEEHLLVSKQNTTNCVMNPRPLTLSGPQGSFLPMPGSTFRTRHGTILDDLTNFSNIVEI